MGRYLGMLTAATALLGSGLIGSGVAKAQTTDPGIVSSSATVGGGGTTAPLIECGWALNDADHNWGSAPVMTYGADDSAAAPVAPAATTDAAPCVTTPAGAAKQDTGWSGMISVKPNAHDEPTQAYVELWGAVSSGSPASTNVTWDVFHPGPANDGNGSFKVQVDGTRYSANGADSLSCAGPASMFATAVSTGQVTSAARDNMINECKYQKKNFWYGAFPISKHQPYGKYKIVMTATLQGGGSSTLTYYINVLSFYKLEADFTQISFGSVSANNHYWSNPEGDFTFGSGGPTLRNTGNAGISIDVSFDPLCLQTAPSCSPLKRIDKFDAHYGARHVANLEYKGANADGSPNIALALAGNTLPVTLLPTAGAPDAAVPTWHTFSRDLPRTMCPNDTGKFEQSIYVEGVNNGAYLGETFIRAASSPLCRTDAGQGEPYSLNYTPYSPGGGVAAPNTVAATGYWV